MEFAHSPVMLAEAVNALRIKCDGVYIDGTAGGAGHSVEIAKRLGTGTLIAIDKDPDAVEAATRRLAPYGAARVIQGDFSDVGLIMDNLNIGKADGILLDLGVSSYQLDNPERGFSYRSDAPLDMRMSQAGTSAYDIVNSSDVFELARIFRDFGEERFAMKIARGIERARGISPVKSTLQLVEIIRSAIPAAARREGGHPAKRSFQALRIAVNSELDKLSQCLGAGFERLNAGGRFAVITFHSLEDRIVKRKFAEFARGCDCPPDLPVCACGKKPLGRLDRRKPVMPRQDEIVSNSRSKSAKLRVVEKI